MKHHKTLVVFLMCNFFLIAPASSLENTTSQYTFAWPFEESSRMKPRGGTTRGSAVALTTRIGFKNELIPLTNFHKDRQAILSMQGGYRVTFDFIETIGFTEDHKPTAPYQSWATEYVYVVKEDWNFISLQHVLVMEFISDDGSVSEPFVMKHWRQDWRYQDTDLHVFVGNNTWERKSILPRHALGKWSQAVFQVDDSPRYEAIGDWEHTENSSIWTSEITSRPLPRREFSVRSDYHMLTGTNRITINSKGWIQEEDNLKTVLAANGDIDIKTPHLAREFGINRYELIKDFDFTPGDTYWKETSEFWSTVRRAWAEIFNEKEHFIVKTKVSNKKLYAVMFQLAEEAQNKTYTSNELKVMVDKTLKKFVAEPNR